MHGLFGPPRRVVSSHIWLDGGVVSAVLAYDGDSRVVATWADLPGLWDFKQTLEVYGSRERVTVRFPTDWSRGLLAVVTVQAI